MALKRTTPDMENSTTLVTGKSRDFVDVDLAFMPKPGSLVDGVRKGDIYKKKDASAVTQSIQNILLTSFYEKPFDVKFGANLRSVLFEHKENYSENYIRKRIMDVLASHEPRAKVENILFYGDDGNEISRGAQTISFFVRNSIKITVEYRLETSGEVITASVNMNRLR
jgi:phage baseplate assembly protein W